MLGALSLVHYFGNIICSCIRKVPSAAPLGFPAFQKPCTEAFIGCAPIRNSERHRPHIAAVRLPVRRDEGSTRDMPTVVELVVAEVLREVAVDVRRVRVTSDGPHVFDQKTGNPRSITQPLP